MNEQIKNVVKDALAIARATGDLTGDLAKALMTGEWARTKALDPESAERAEAEASIANEVAEAAILRASDLAISGLTQIARDAGVSKPPVRESAAKAFDELTRQVQSARGGGPEAANATDALIGNLQGLLTGAISDVRGQAYRNIVDPAKADLSARLQLLLREGNYVENVGRLNELSKTLSKATLAVAGILGASMQAAVKGGSTGITVGIPGFLSSILPEPLRGVNQITLAKGKLQAADLDLGNFTATTKLVKGERDSGISYRWDRPTGGFIRISGSAKNKGGQVTGGSAEVNVGSKLFPAGIVLSASKDNEGSGGGVSAYWENDRIRVTGQASKANNITEATARLDASIPRGAVYAEGRAKEGGERAIEVGIKRSFGAMPRRRRQESKGLHGNPRLVRKLAGPLPRLQSIFSRLRQRGELRAPDPVLEPQTPLAPEAPAGEINTQLTTQTSSGATWGWIAAGVGVIGLIGGVMWMRQRSDT